MKKSFKLFLLFGLFQTVSLNVAAQRWQPDAGLVKPFEALVITSSGNNVQWITDGDQHTYWESGNPLPFHYITQKRMNFFLNKNSYHVSSAQESISYAFDGNPNTKSHIKNGSLKLTIPSPQQLNLLTLKADVSDSLKITLQYEDKSTQNFVYLPGQKFKLVNYRLPAGRKLSRIQLSCSHAFDLFELAALKGLPAENVLFDFGRSRKIGWIASRHLNSRSVKSIAVSISEDGSHWKPLLHLNPEAIPYLQIPLKQIVSARFLKIIFTLSLADYKKASLWEFAVYGPYGPYGKAPEPKISALNFAHAFGINTFWGWGYSVYSDLLKPGTGPAEFQTITHQLRNYHPLDWDIKSPQHLPDYSRMTSGHGTPAKPWLNWDREYRFWETFGFHIDATISFNANNFPDSLWLHPYQEAYDFGQKFAKHFCKPERPLIEKVEIGNEPWNYPPAIYQRILAGMSKGIKSVSRVPVLPCAVQAYDPNNDNHNYISNYLNPENSIWLDGLNCHIYSYIFREDGKRVAVMPEDRRSAVWSMANLSRYRDKNMPGKKIDVTEFGFDSGGAGEDCTHSECVNERQQAIFGVRMALILWRLGAENFYWYYFANVAYDSFLHNRSGLCGSYKTGFKKKLSFIAFRRLFQEIGSYHFIKVVREDTTAYAYLYKNFTNGKEILIVWRPVANQDITPKWISIPMKQQIIKIQALLGNKTISPQFTAKGFELQLTDVPVFVEF